MMAVERLVNNSRILTGGSGVVPFSGSLLSKAIAVLVKYGGSLWVAEPDDTFVNSDGTGAASDGSDAGYVRDLCASYGPELRAGKFNNSDGATFTNNADGSTTVTTNGSQTYAYAGWFGDVVQGKVYEVATNANASSRWIYYLHTPGQTDYVNIGSTASGVVGEARNVVSVPTGQGTRTRLLAIRQVGPEFGAGSFTVQPASIREVISRPLFQATTSFKPKLKRVPKRLGPELVTNGDFASATGWSLGTNWSISGGVATHGASGVNTLTQAIGTTAGKTYVVAWQISAVTSVGGGISARIGTGGAGSVLGGVYSAAGSYVDILTPSADQTGFQFITRGAVGDWQGSIDNVSVREVIEWGWAWVGDGTDDTLVSAVQPTTNTAETMGVAFWNTGVNSKANAQHFINRRNAGAHAGQAIFQATGVSSVSFVAGMGSASTTNTTQPALQAGVVASIQSDGTVSRRFANGEQKGTDYPGAYSFATSAPIYLLSSQGSANSFCDRPVFAAYYAPAMLPTAERLIVERAMAQLAGVDI